MQIMLRFAALAMVVLASGCAHNVAFQDVDYRVDEELRDEPVVAVISNAERARVVPVRAFMTGIANSWEAEPGIMLMQVVEIELPQMFSQFEISNTVPNSRAVYVLEMSVPDYHFEEFRAKIDVHARMTGLDGQELLDQLYQAEGPSRGGRMFWGGAFGMKSAMRTSSIEAFKVVFASLRADLNRILDSINDE